jgi:hypothetical protein
MDVNHEERENSLEKIKVAIKSNQEMMEAATYSIWQKLKETIKNLVEDTPL